MRLGSSNFTDNFNKRREFNNEVCLESNQHPDFVVYRHFLSVVLSSFLLGTAPSSAQIPTPTKSRPVPITQGWQYRWGDSPVDDNGVPVWTKEDVSNANWKPLSIDEPITKPDKNIKIAWLRVPLPKGQWKSPALFQQFSTLLEVYLENQLIRQVASPDSFSEFPLTKDNQQSEKHWQ